MSLTRASLLHLWLSFHQTREMKNHSPRFSVLFYVLNSSYSRGESWVGLAEAAAMATTDHFKILISCAFVPGARAHYYLTMSLRTCGDGPASGSDGHCRKRVPWMTNPRVGGHSRKKRGGEKKGNTIELKSRFSGEDFFQCVSFFYVSKNKNQSQRCTRNH